VSKPRVRRSVLAVLCLSVGACASAPEHLYTLDTSERPPATSRPDLPIVLVGPVAIPEMLDRPQLVVREGKYGIVFNEQQRWATPLKDSLPIVIATELGEHCPRAIFRLRSGIEAEVPHALLTIEFTNIEINRATGTSVVATWAYRNGDQRGIESAGDGQADIGSANFSGYVDSLQRALRAWAKDVAPQLPPCQSAAAPNAMSRDTTTPNGEG
jgi:uncharacterized lipoprotein YmbA